MRFAIRWWHYLIGAKNISNPPQYPLTASMFMPVCQTGRYRMKSTSSQNLEKAKMRCVSGGDTNCFTKPFWQAEFSIFNVLICYNKTLMLLFVVGISVFFLCQVLRQGIQSLHLHTHTHRLTQTRIEIEYFEGNWFMLHNGMPFPLHSNRMCAASFFFCWQYGPHNQVYHCVDYIWCWLFYSLML